MKKAPILTLIGLSAVSCSRKSMDEQFAENCKQETQQMCPRKIDSCTRLDSIVFDMKTRVQKHYYTFSGTMDDESIFTEYLVEDIRETMLKSLRNEIKLKKQMEAKIGFGYYYRSEKSKKKLLEIVFTPEDYTGPMKMRSFEERMQGKWEDYTAKHCPEVQDICTTLTKVAYDSLDNRICYEFELKGELDTDSFNIIYPDAKKELKNVLISGIKKNEMLEEERDSCLDFNIRYISKRTGKLMVDINIAGKDVQKKK